MIYIIDDDPDFCATLAKLLESSGYKVGAFTSAAKFLASLKPDDGGCVITDVRMPGMSGVELLAKLKEAGLAIPVIVATAYADVPLAVQVMKQGAVDLLQKPFTGDALLAAVAGALDNTGGRLTRKVEIRAIRKRLAALTAREHDVLVGLLNGRANKAIAHCLGIGTRTVETHRAAIMEKMCAESFSELVRLCLIADVNRDRS